MLAVSTQIKQTSLSAVITRADGTVEDLGPLVYYHRNPLLRLTWRIAKTLGLRWVTRAMV